MSVHYTARGWGLEGVWRGGEGRRGTYLIGRLQGEDGADAGTGLLSGHVSLVCRMLNSLIRANVGVSLAELGSV